MTRPMVARWLALLAVALGPGTLLAETPPAPPATRQVLTDAAGVRGLDEAAARQGLPARLRGVVMIDASNAAGKASLYIADSSACLFIGGKASTCGSLKRGQVVEIQGRTVAGLFAPYVWAESVACTGTAPIPEPLSISLDALASGRLVGQWVRVRGVIRRADPVQSGPESWRFELVSGNSRLTGAMRTPASAPPPVDAEVEVSGLCSGRFDKSRQWLGPHLIVPAGVAVTVLKPAPTESPLRPMNRLMAFWQDDSNTHRVRVRGVVTHCVPGESFWMQCEDRGLRVITSNDMPLVPGETVEALGFAAPGKYSPVLEDVTVTRLAYTAPPAARKLTKPVEALDHDEQLVCLDGRVTSQKPNATGVRITLRQGPTEFDVRIERLPGIDPLTSWPLGARLRATGICLVTDLTPADSPSTFDSHSFRAFSVQHREDRYRDFGPQQPGAFDLLARSPADLVVIAPPPWWTAARITWLLGLTSLALVMGIGTVVALARHRLRQAALGRRRAEAEFAAILNERSRIAREIHDTLAQSLGATSLHLELVKDYLPPDSEGARNLAEARRLTLGGLTETRNSIWEMRSQALETGDLATALMDVRDQLTDIQGIKGRFDLSGPPYRLPPLTENNLLRIGQEAITNAVKHARATRVDVRLAFLPGELQLCISDDGCGFDPDHTPPGETHFGWIGLRERAHEIHAELTVNSAPNEGTRVELILHHSQSASLNQDPA